MNGCESSAIPQTRAGTDRLSVLPRFPQGRAHTQAETFAFHRFRYDRHTAACRLVPGRCSEAAACSRSMADNEFLRHCEICASPSALAEGARRPKEDRKPHNGYGCVRKNYNEALAPSEVQTSLSPLANKSLVAYRGLFGPIWNIVHQIQRKRFRRIRQRLRLPCQQILLVHLSCCYTRGES